MKTSILRVAATMAALSFIHFGCMTPEECKEYKTSTITVKVKFFAHNMTAGGQINYYMEKMPCGESITDKVELNAAADAFGDFESNEYSYSLSNTFDHVYYGYGYLYSQQHGGLSQYSGQRLDYDTLDSYNGRTFYVDLDYKPQIVHDAWVAWKSHQNSNMKYCYDLAYYMLLGLPPANVTKSMLFQKMKEAGYSVVESGLIPTSVYFEEKDILVFDFDKLPDEINPPHIAVVLGHAIWQIFPWNNGSEFDGPRELAWFKNRPNLVDPYTGTEVPTVNQYKFYKLYSKTSR